MKKCGTQVWSQVGRQCLGKPGCIWANQSSQQKHSLCVPENRNCFTWRGDPQRIRQHQQKHWHTLWAGQASVETSKAGHVHCCLSSHTMGRISPFCWHSDIITSQEISLIVCPMGHAHRHCSDSGITECQGCSAAQWTAVGQGIKVTGQERWPEIPVQGERRHPAMPVPCTGKGHQRGWWHWDWGCSFPRLPSLVPTSVLHQHNSCSPHELRPTGRAIHSTHIPNNSPSSLWAIEGNFRNPVQPLSSLQKPPALSVPKPPQAHYSYLTNSFGAFFLMKATKTDSTTHITSQWYLLSLSTNNQSSQQNLVFTCQYQLCTYTSFSACLPKYPCFHVSSLSMEFWLGLSECPGTLMMEKKPHTLDSQLEVLF